MHVLLSCILSYMLCGLGKVSESLRADPLQMPGWAFRPTLGKMLLVGITWPFAVIVNAPSVGFGIFVATLQFAELGLFAWCCITVALFLFRDFILQILSCGVFLLFGAYIIRPLVSMITIFIVTALVLPFSFFRTSDKINRDVPWCRNCTHYRKSPRYEKIPGGLHLAGASFFRVRQSTDFAHICRQQGIGM